MEARTQLAQSIVGTSKGRPADDFYPTPEAVTRALLERERFTETVWEPACGNGAMAEVIRKAGYRVYATDLHDRGYGMVGIDFLQTQVDWDGQSIITNPPFKLAEEFLQKALATGAGKVALFAKLAFLEGEKRTRILENSPLRTVYVFRKRVKMGRNGEAYKANGMIAFAWYVWERNYDGRPTIEWI